VTGRLRRQACENGQNDGQESNEHSTMLHTDPPSPLSGWIVFEEPPYDFGTAGAPAAFCMSLRSRRGFG